MFLDRAATVTVVLLPSSSAITQRAIGASRDRISDEFAFHFEPADKLNIKRGILANVSSLFDPLGLVAPLCLPAKQLLQILCKFGLGWDQINTADVTA